MKKEIKNLVLAFMASTLLMSCGQDNGGGSIQMTRGNIPVEVSLSSVSCFQEFNGAMFCRLEIRTQNNFSDFIDFTAYQPINIFDNLLGVPLAANGADMGTVMTFQGIQTSIDNSTVTYTRMSNISGDRVCAEFQLNVFVQGAANFVQGNFCGTII